MDEVFGEDNFVATVIWEKVYSPKSSAKYFSENHDFIVIYARSKERFRPVLLPRTDEANARYSNPDDDPRGPWKPSDLSARNPYSKGLYSITCPGGRVIETPPGGRFWSVSEERFWALHDDHRIWWGADGKPNASRQAVSFPKCNRASYQRTIWTYKEVGHTQDARKGLLQIFPKTPPTFTTKPVELLKRIVHLSTDKDSIVLDSFAGSGTTAHAVLALNKEDGGNRRFVLIECEDYADGITAERVRRVIKGVPTAKDPTLKAGFGGAFSYFDLGQPMRRQSILDGSNLPPYEKLASYIFFTATGEELDPATVDLDTWFIGSSKLYDVFLIYAEDIAKLKDMALTSAVAARLPKSGRARLVFAPTKYMDREFLHRYRITFQQLPFEIYEAVETLER